MLRPKLVLLLTEIFQYWPEVTLYESLYNTILFDINHVFANSKVDASIAI